MSLVAFLLPPRWRPPDFAAAFPPDVFRAIEEERTALVQAVLTSRPDAGTPAERAVLAQLITLSLPLAKHVMPMALVESFRVGLQMALLELIEAEKNVATSREKLALRHIEQATNTFGVYIEALARVLGSLSPADHWLLVDHASDVPAEELLGSDENLLHARFSLDLMMSFECLRRPLDDLTYWAFRAITTARAIEGALPTGLPSGIRGDVARLRARASWKNWDREEIAREFAEWPTVGPSR